MLAMTEQEIVKEIKRRIELPKKYNFTRGYGSSLQEVALLIIQMREHAKIHPEETATEALENLEGLIYRLGGAEDSQCFAIECDK